MVTVQREKRSLNSTTRRWVRSPRTILTRLFVVAVALLTWEVLSVTGVRLWLSFDKLPPPSSVALVLVQQLGTSVFYQDIGASLARIAIGFLLACVVGVILGILQGRSALVENTVGTLVEIVRPIPAIALVPIALLLFPTNEQGIVAITFAAAVFPIIISTKSAVRTLLPTWDEAVRTMGGSRTTVILRVVLPGALPGIFAGFSVGLGVSWVCVISAEMISGQFGVGYRTWQAYTLVDYPSVIAGMVVIGLLGMMTTGLVTYLGRRSTTWAEKGAGNE
ncbi:ABC transporter permease [Microbacterium suaedae]|uniref:ABC transporter permease n=1 Tax=Microbacterium suaedae TaxID=2067813 RepID=UPI000DA13A30|nr:ABC transporter permease [Microbacterium suaedae]